MRKTYLLLGTIMACFAMPQLQAQSLSLGMPDTTVAPNDLISVPIRTADFDEVVSMQFSIRWDTAVMSYVGNEDADLDNVAIGDFQAAKGEIRLSWFDVEGMGHSLPDGSVITFLQFMARGAEGSSTPIDFTDTPLPTQIYRTGNSPGEFDELSLAADNGSVTIMTPMSVTVVENVSDISCFGAADGQISINVTANEQVQISWTGPNFTSDAASINGLAPGQYELRVTNTAGAVLYESTIIVTEPSALRISNITAVDANCASGRGSAQVIFTGGTAPYTYDVGNGPGTISVLENLAPAAYTLLLKDANGCTASDTFSINNPGLPTLELGEAVQICSGESTTLQASAFSSYLWSTGATTSGITVSQPGTYGLTVTNADGCQATDAVEVQAGENVQLLLDNDFLDLCPGDSIELMVSGADTYLWIDTSASLNALDIANPIARPDTTVAYRVIGRSACGADTLDLEVFVYEVMAMAGPDTCIGPGTEAQLMAYGGLSYQWEDARYPVSDPNIPNPTASPEDSITYVVAITDYQGCVIRDSLVVLVANDPEATIRAVNMITPNGDGRNDVLYFPNIEKYGQNSLKVFNRWGNTVYQKVNYQQDEERFDGTYKGQPLPPGTYYYLLAFRTGEIKQKLTILR